LIAAFENVGYRTRFEHKMLCFAKQISFGDIMDAQEAYDNMALKVLHVYKWHKHLRDGHVRVNDEQHYGQP
jgi:hypothetical protein